MLLSIAASAKRHGVNPWTYITHILTASATRKSDAGFNDLLPDAWLRANTSPAA